MAVCDLAVVLVEDEGLRCVQSLLVTLEDHKGLLVLASYKVEPTKAHSMISSFSTVNGAMPSLR